MSGSDDEDLVALRRVVAGSADAWRPVIDRHRAGLMRMIRYRLDDRLRGRLDASDLVQEVFAEAAAKVEAYVARPGLSPIVWLRLMARERLIDVRRHHLGAQKRAAHREEWKELTCASSADVAREVSNGLPGPLTAALRDEVREKVTEALNQLSEEDRELIVLRHFEQLGNADVAAELGIAPAAASKRYIRALEKLGGALEGVLGPGGGSSLR